jgi:serine protease Do
LSSIARVQTPSAWTDHLEEENQMKSSTKKIALGATATAFVLAGCMLGERSHAGSAPAAAREPATETAAKPARALPSFADLAERVSPSVVFIKAVSVEKTADHGQEFDWAPWPFGRGGPAPGFRFPSPQPPAGGFKRQGTGSGFVVREDGVILTNNHVVENAKQITVTLTDEREYPARVVGRDPKTDLAVLKIDAKEKLPVATLGNSDQLRVGDWVMAIGNPFGLSNTVTAGIVSAKGRVIGAGPYDAFIQTDASINPGNSGGPLFNEKGEAVGINSAIFSQSGGNIGIGFAIPINLAKQLLPELEAHGSVTRGWLGVAIQKITPDLATSLDLGTAHGALVADVTRGGPADEAGVKRGDVIERFDGKAVDEANALPALVAAEPVGKNVTLELRRNGKEKTVEVTIAKLKDDEAENTEPQSPDSGKWGLGLRDLTPQERTRAGLPHDEGVLVTEVAAGSPADDAGVQSGDIILQVNRTPVSSVSEVKEQVAKVSGDHPLLLLLRQSSGESRFAALTTK